MYKCFVNTDNKLKEIKTIKYLKQTFVCGNAQKQSPSLKHYFILKLMFQCCRPCTLWGTLKHCVPAEVEFMQERCVEVCLNL